MQSELSITSTRKLAASTLSTRAQQRQAVRGRPQGNQTAGLSQSTPKRSTRPRPKQTLDPALSTYTHNALFPERTVRYILPRNRVSLESASLNAEALKRLQTSPVLGFDMEWKPCFVKGEKENPVALIQLAGEKDIALVHVHYTGILKLLQDILGNPNILKVGVGITEDINKLARDWKVEVNGVMDLSDIARRVDPYWAELDRQKQEAMEAARLLRLAEAQAKGLDITAENPRKAFQSSPNGSHPPKNENEGFKKDKVHLISLARLTARYLSLNLVKGKIARTNWEQQLNQAQIIYAANDAAVAYDIYHKLRLIEEGAAPLPT